MARDQEENKKVYNTAVYIRLSREDGDKAESDSIRNQRMLITNYLESRKEFKIYDEYVDDGYSGTNFDRPAFQRFLKDAGEGKVNTLIVKDLSRFGRNYIETGKYLERILPEMGIRVIAINDHYDGKAEWQRDDLIIPVKNLMNDAYCRDISVKIRSQLGAKRKRGDFTGSFAPYGYRKCLDDHNKLVIDEEAAKQVSRIFRMRLEGMCPYGIAKQLNEEGVPSPLEYKHSLGCKMAAGFKTHDTARWDAKSVIRITQNAIYKGTLQQGKRKKLDYRSKDVIPVPEEKWDVTERACEPIIMPETFDLVQELSLRDSRSAVGERTVSVLSGYLYCGDCKSPMARRATTKNGKKYPAYVCDGYKKGSGCTSHYIGYKKLEKAVLRAMQDQIALAEKQVEILRHIDRYSISDQKLKELGVSIAKVRDEIEALRLKKETLFSSFSSGMLSQQDYLDFSEIYTKRITEKEREILRIRQEQESIEKETDSDWVKEFLRFRNIKTLTRQAVVFLIDRIYVYDDKRIEVKFRFQDEIDSLMKRSWECQEDADENMEGSSLPERKHLE